MNAMTKITTGKPDARKLRAWADYLLTANGGDEDDDIADYLRAQADAIDAGSPVVTMQGHEYMTNATGHLVPLELVRPANRLQDEVVRKIFAYAEDLSAQVSRFRQHTFDDVDSFVGLLNQEYGANKGSGKGNITLTSYDGLKKVIVQNADLIDFGPELASAKLLVDECLMEWSGDSNANIRAIVNRAFNVDGGKGINRAELLSLLRLDLEDDRWQRAMQAIRDSMQITGSKRYVRFYKRNERLGKEIPVVIDVAAS